MQRTIPLLGTILFLSTTLGALAQSEFLGLPGSAYIDSLGYSHSIRTGARENPMGERAQDGRFWTTRNVSATYSFEKDEAKNSALGEDKMHSFVLELYQESDSGWILNLGGIYAEETFDQDGFFSRDSEQNYRGVSAQPAYDFFALWQTNNRPECLKQSRLIFGVGGDYIRSEGEYESTGFFPPRFETEAESYAVIPNLVFVHPVTEKLTTYWMSAYLMSWTETEIKPFFNTIKSEYGFITVTGRGDYQLCESSSVAAFATWKRDAHTEPSRKKYDWAEFGGQLRFDWNKHFGAQVGYSYEAFHPRFDGHLCFARLNAAF